MAAVKTVANTFKSVKHTDISQSTIKNYLDYLCDSFLIERTNRDDSGITIMSVYDFLLNDNSLEM